MLGAFKPRKNSDHPTPRDRHHNKLAQQFLIVNASTLGLAYPDVRMLLRIIRTHILHYSVTRNPGWPISLFLTPSLNQV